MNLAGRGLRAVLAVILFAGPAAAQIRVVPTAGSPVSPRLAGAAVSAPAALSFATVPAAPVFGAMPPVGPSAAAAALPTAVAALTGPDVGARAGTSAASAPRAAASGHALDDLKAAAAAADEEANVPEDIPNGAADAVPQLLEMFVPGESRKGVKSGNLTAHVGLIRGKGSEWYWGKFQKGMTIALKSGGKTMFATKVENAKTIKIASMQLQDFAGLFTAQRMAGKTVYDLRNALVQDLKKREARRYNGPAPVSMQTEVRMVRFLSSVKARELPENRDEPAYPVLPRRQFDLPPALQGLNHLLPKAVLVDMRLFPDGMPYPLIEDMTKLMKAGVYFVLLSHAADSGPGSVEDLLTRQLGLKQRDLISRYKMLVLSDDGNSLHSGNFSKPLPSVRFTPEQLEMMAFVAASQASAASVDAKSTRFEVVLPKGADAEKFRASVFKSLQTMSLHPEKWQWSLSSREGKPVITVRPQNLVSALPHLMEVMRVHERLYVNNNDLMVISRDQTLLGALPGSVQPAAHLQSDGEAFADQSLASLLGPYRENKPEDLAVSASKISSFLQDPNRGAGDFGNIYMMTGHVMHSALLNWAIWRYRNTGVLPTADEIVATGNEVWEHEIRAAKKNLLSHTGENLAGFYETVEKRLRATHQIVSEVLKSYPIVVGSELPNLFMIDHWKKGAFDHSDILRLIFDLVVARENADGTIDVMIVDLKTGQVANLQNLEKDVQVQLYDMVVRQMWKKLPLPYGGTGKPHTVANFKLKFVYTAGAYQPELNDWSRLKFGKFIERVTNRIRRHNNPPAPKAASGAKGGADSARKAPTVKVDRTRPKTAGDEGLELPRTVPGLKIKKAYAQKIVAGTKKIEYRSFSTTPKGFIAIIQTFTDEEPGRPAEVVAFARLARVTRSGGAFEWHLTNVTPVKPYIVPNNKPGTVTWVKDVPVQGPRRLKRDK